jgi:bifunctional DNA-binding transcriptional regulator/antitoxin component of YhaV-PrlF toxin-antitoxin module
MGKVTSKLQVTIPKALAEATGVREGTEVAFDAVGGALRMTPLDAAGRARVPDLAWRLRLFDAATRRQRERDATRAGRRPGKSRPPGDGRATDRGWTREELHGRGLGR